MDIKIKEAIKFLEQNGYKVETIKKEAQNISSQQDMFESFWELYPKKVGKKQCVEYWKRGKFSVSLFDKIMSALNKQIQHKIAMDSKQEFCPELPHPIRWLRHCRWEDIIIEPRGNFNEFYQKPKYNSRDER